MCTVEMEEIMNAPDGRLTKKFGANSKAIGGKGELIIDAEFIDNSFDADLKYFFFFFFFFKVILLYFVYLV